MTIMSGKETSKMGVDVTFDLRDVEAMNAKIKTLIVNAQMDDTGRKDLLDALGDLSGNSNMSFSVNITTSKMAGLAQSTAYNMKASVPNRGYNRFIFMHRSLLSGG